MQRSVSILFPYPRTQSRGVCVCARVHAPLRTHTQTHPSLGRANIHLCQVERFSLGEAGGREGVSELAGPVLVLLMHQWCSPIKGSHLSAHCQSTLTLLPRKRHPRESEREGWDLEGAYSPVVRVPGGRRELGWSDRRVGEGAAAASQGSL